MQTAVEILVALSFFIFGLSHIVQPRAWAEFFIRLRHKGTVGILQLGLPSCHSRFLSSAFTMSGTGCRCSLP